MVLAIYQILALTACLWLLGIPAAPLDLDNGRSSIASQEMQREPVSVLDGSVQPE